MRPLHTNRQVFSAKSATPDCGAAKLLQKEVHRSVTPEQTLETLQKLAPQMGITRVANITGLDEIGIFVATACRPNSRNIAVSQGKGLSLAAAKVSALMESLEGFHAEQIMLPLKLATYEELGNVDRVVDVRRLAGVVSSKFHCRLPMLWIVAQNLQDDGCMWLPFECVHTNFVLPLPPGSHCFQGSSNGLGAGNHLLEAISHGICELVERDATALWWVSNDNERASRRIELSTIDEVDCCNVLSRYESAGLNTAIWEMTTDIAISSFICVISSRSDDGDQHLVADGMGCHPSRGIALLRALTEAAQTRLTLISGARDDLSRTSYRQPQAQSSAIRLKDLSEQSSIGRHFRDGIDFVTNSLTEEVAWELKCLQNSGFVEVLVVDLTQARLNIPVVRVVIPGLEGVCFQPDYLPGRRAEAKRSRPV